MLQVPGWVLLCGAWQAKRSSCFSVRLMKIRGRNSEQESYRYGVESILER